MVHLPRHCHEAPRASRAVHPRKEEDELVTPVPRPRDHWRSIRQWQRDILTELLQELGEVGQAIEAQLQEHFQRQELLINQQTMRIESALHSAVEAAAPSSARLELLPLLQEQTQRIEAVLLAAKQHGTPGSPAGTAALASSGNDLQDSPGNFASQRSATAASAKPTSPDVQMQAESSSPSGEQKHHHHGARLLSNGSRSAAVSEDGAIPIPSYLSHGCDKTPHSPMVVEESSGHVPSVRDRRAQVRHDNAKLWLGEHILSRCDSLLDWWFELKEPERKGPLAKFVEGKWFELFTTLIILANSAVTISTTNYEAMYLTEDKSYSTAMANLGFVIYYTFELVLKLMVHRLYFFANDEVMWNMFDLLLVGFAIFEVFFAAQLTEPVNVTHMRSMRVSLRVLRTAKTLRMMRVVRSFQELRLLMNSVLGSMPSLFWSIIMLTFMFFIFSLIFVQGATLELINNRGNLSPAAIEVLHTHMGSTQMAMLMLFKSTTGGEDWENYFWALTETGWWNCALFLFFIAFAQIALLNILTGIFVENAMKLAEPDRDSEALQRRKKELKDAEDLRTLCQIVDPEGTGKISEERFMQELKSSQFRARLQLLGLDIKDATLFFQVVSSGYDKEEVEIEAFVSGAMRLKGAATSLDLQALMFRTRLIYSNQLQILEHLDRLEVSECSRSQTPG